MATQVQFRGGTTSEHSTFTGVAREVTVDTTKKTVVVHDGSTAGGIPLAKESAATSAVAITGGSINGTTVGAATPTTGAFTTLSASSTVTLIGLTASTNLALDASKNVVSVTNTGTGNNVLSASPTLTGTIAGASLSLSSLTSGRVTYAGASGLLSDNANFTYNGTALTVSASSAISGVFNRNTSSGATVDIQVVGGSVGTLGSDTGGNGFLDIAAVNSMYLRSTGASSIMAFSTNNTEKMRITSAGNVGIGTSSPISVLDIYAAPGAAYIQMQRSDQAGFGARFGVADTLISGTPVRACGVDGFNAICFGIGGTGVARFDSSGNLLIGNSTDALGSNRLYVQSASTAANNRTFSIYNTAATSTATFANRLMQISSNGSGADVNIHFSDQVAYNAYIGMNSGALYFGTNGTNERMRIDSAGDLLLGTTSNTTNGGFIFATNFYGAGRSVQVIGHINGASSGDAYMIFNYNGTGIGSITQTGTTGVLYNVTSDQRLKTNVVDALSGNIDDIKVRSFDWIADGSHQEYGMVAQELIEVAPYAVNKPENPDEMMGVDYSKLVPMMIKEIQDLKAEVNQLKAKIGV